jgi:hypothetical protein
VEYYNFQKNNGPVEDSMTFFNSISGCRVDFAYAKRKNFALFSKIETKKISDIT